MENLTVEQLRQIIIIAISMLGGILILIAFLLTFVAGRYTVKNNPNKAKIYILNGSNIDRVYTGKLVDSSRKGYRYNYKAFGKKMFTIVSRKLDEIYCLNQRMIFLKRIGQIISSPLPYDTNVELTLEEKSDLIYEFVESKIGADTVRAIKGKLALPSIMVIIIIALVVGIGGFMAVNYMSKQIPQQTNQPKVTENTTLPRPEIVR